MPSAGRFRLLDVRRSREWFTVIGVAPDLQHVRRRPERQRAAGRGVRARTRISEALSTGLTIRVARRSGGDHGGGPRRAFARPIRTCRSPGAHDGRRAPAEFLAVRALRLDLRDDRRRRPAARVDRRLRRAVVLRVAAHAGDRRARGARRRSRVTSSGWSSDRALLLAGIGVAVGLVLVGRRTPLARDAPLQRQPVRSAHLQRRVDVPRRAWPFWRATFRRGARRGSIRSSRCEASDTPASPRLDPRLVLANHRVVVLAFRPARQQSVQHPRADLKVGTTWRTSPCIAQLIASCSSHACWSPRRGRPAWSRARPAREGERHRQAGRAHLRHSRRQRRPRAERRHRRRLPRDAGDRSRARDAATAKRCCARWPRSARTRELYIASTHFHAEHTTGYLAFPADREVRELDGAGGRVRPGTARSRSRPSPAGRR